MRLIDADEALRLFGKEYEKTKELIHNGETQLDSLAEGFTEAHHIIKYVLPTVGAVPVVRCKDCKHAYINSFAVSSGEALCTLSGKPMQQDDFCSYGEPKEG
nr:MAG TPA: adenylate kinase [Caudoviricetes sp.]